MLLYLVKYIRPNIANMTRELSKVNIGVNFAAFCEMLHVIVYLLDTENLVLKLEPFGDGSSFLSYNNYASDPISRRIIICFILYLLVALFSWHSKAQKSLILSSSET